MTGIRLGANQHGKAEVRIVKVSRVSTSSTTGEPSSTTGEPSSTTGEPSSTTGERHTIEDLNVTSQLRGDFEAAFTEGDNSHVHATDTQKNSVYALAKEHGIGSPEAFLLTLADHWTAQDWVTGGRWAAEQYSWERIVADGKPHDHSFVRAGQETRTAVVQRDGDETFVVAGLEDCVVLKSTGSEFHGFPRDRFTTLAETDDRILATSLTASWRYADLGVDYNATYTGIRQILLETFASVHSLALQQSMFAMGKAVLEQYDEVAEVRLSCPNKHHFLVDLEPFGLDNPGEIFFAADRPYGLIEATVVRDGVADEPRAWA